MDTLSSAIQGVPSAWRHGTLRIVTKRLREDLRAWAQASAWREVKEQLRQDVPAYEIEITYAKGGYVQNLFYDTKLICSLRMRNNFEAIDLYLPQRMPVGPWDETTVVKLFKGLRPKKIVVPEGKPMPKVKSWRIEHQPESDHINRFKLKIFFEGHNYGSALIEISNYERQTDLIVMAMDTGLESSGGCHFEPGGVWMFFPTRALALKAEKRVEKICGHI